MTPNKTSGQLISKKELLEKYKISYGALYRWKRKGLIPEDWFIKKATSTGQETFFNRDHICERIETILSLKDSLSLEEIAEQLNKKEKASEAKLQIHQSNRITEISVSDLQKITLSLPSGYEIDITEKITELLKKEN